MRRAPTVALVVLSLAGLSAGRGAVAAPGADPERAARELDDPRWEVRRAATVALLVDGRAALSETVDDSGPAATARLARWLATVEGRIATGSATAAGRARALLSIVETEAGPETVRASATLLRERVGRLLTTAATTASEDAVVDESDDAHAPPREVAQAAREALVVLLPQARPLLLAAIARSGDPAEIAGALSVLAADDGSGPDDETTAVVAARRAADPAPLLAVRELYTPGASMEAVTSVALSLALRGDPAGAARLDRDRTLATPLRARLAARGDADLTTGAFLGEVGEGRAAVADAIEAARRLASLGLAPFARLAARRALFLDPSSEAARRALVDADVAAGLGDTARKDAGATTPVPAGTSADDVPAARALDDALRAGRFAERLAWRHELGSTRRPGTPPIAIGGGFVASGGSDGRVVLLDPATGVEKASVSTSPLPREPSEPSELQTARVPRGVAIAAGRLAAVSGRGALLLWTLAVPMATPLSETTGPFGSVAAGPDGSFWLASAGRRIHRVAPGATRPEPVTRVPASPELVPVALHVLADGTLLLRSRTAIERIDPTKGTVAGVFEGRGAFVCAPFGDAVLLGMNSAWGTVRDGEPRLVGEAPDDGVIVGIAGDAAAGVVYLTLRGETVAVGAEDGHVLWRRGIEGGGNPVLGDGLLVVPAGAGREPFGGDNRSDRTLSALTTSRPPSDVFSEAAIARVVAAATAAVKEGRVEVGVLMLDPVRDWAGADLAVFDAAVSAAREGESPAKGDEPAPEPAPDPAPDPAPEPTPEPAPEPAPMPPPEPVPPTPPEPAPAPRPAGR